MPAPRAYRAARVVLEAGWKKKGSKCPTVSRKPKCYWDVRHTEEEKQDLYFFFIL